MKKATLGYRIRTCMMVNTLNASALVFSLYIAGVVADRQEAAAEQHRQDNSYTMEVVPDKKEARR